MRGVRGSVGSRRDVVGGRCCQKESQSDCQHIVLGRKRIDVGICTSR